jgi:hypothetical protein
MTKPVEGVNMSLLSAAANAAVKQTPDGVSDEKVVDKKKRTGRQKEVRQQKYHAALTIESWIKSIPNVQPPAPVAEALKLLCKQPGVRTGGGFAGTPVLNKLFGDNPEVGMKLTIRDVFDKTMKGMTQMNGLMRKWAEKGVVVQYTHNSAEPFKSTYEITAINK